MNYEHVTRSLGPAQRLSRDRVAGAIESVEQLLQAIEGGTVSWDALTPESLEEWEYWCDYRNGDGTVVPVRDLTRFDPADSAESNAGAMAWRWDEQSDTWHIWPGGNAKAFEFGWGFVPIEPQDLEAAKDSIRQELGGSSAT
jgi:hypothetical protein